MATVELTSSLRKVKLDRSKIRKDCNKALSLLGLGRVELGVHLVGDRRIRTLNRVHRRVDRVTDVISFPLYGSPDEFPKTGPVLLGDIFVNPLVARQRALAGGVTTREELLALIIHGLLHLAGYDHEVGPHRRRKMLRMEEKLLRELI